MDRKQIRSVPIRPEEITPKHIYQSRRQFLKNMGFVGMGALLASCAPGLTPPDELPTGLPTDFRTDNMNNLLTSYDAITGYCNFYEFTTDKETVDEKAQDFVTSPWSVAVTGLVENPRIFTMEEILEAYEQEERIYRMRCVEGWSMVIPWMGFPLQKLLEDVRPTSEAKFVLFESALVPGQMDNANSDLFPFPYLEGLRLDEAMHDLTILATGLYNEPLPPQNGAPIRLVVPWKYGFKSIKSIVRISLVPDQPPTLWNTIAPNEYGFYANVNPDVDHPRWSQATERRIGDAGRIPTLFMNGYAEEVMPLYEGMDLEENF
ncbi:MAG TPA: protein-methionine-sulfoxide reductase catalytic subunit MsrP [Anaerolineaceae bacterium]|nr:MAG: Sulfoxide reductase catalytic subunit YedY [Anaerolineaceae bacterium 46_22]HAF49163.1 protein-methionine-sulfoxide reductase catalytic subunit MsrP [Anaerolineaceae bacterium]